MLNTMRHSDANDRSRPSFSHCQTQILKKYPYWTHRAGIDIDNDDMNQQKLNRCNQLSGDQNSENCGRKREVIHMNPKGRCS